MSKMRFSTRLYLIPILVLCLLCVEIRFKINGLKITLSKMKSDSFRINRRLKDLMNYNRSNGASRQMIERRLKIGEICDRFGSPSNRDPLRFVGFEGFDIDQKIEHLNFLRDLKSRTLYCFVHKAGSSTMMDIFSRLENDTDFLNGIRDGRRYHYEIKYRMGPNLDQLLEVLSSPSYYTFIFTRHPFERLLSAYRDRILGNPCSDQAAGTAIEMFGAQVLSKRGCVITRITFEEFVEYVARVGRDNPDSMDIHWKPMFKLCAPCLIHYDGIFRAEEYSLLLKETGISRFIKDGDSIKRNPTKNGSTSKYLFEYFSKISCKTLRELEKFYRMDFLLFGYGSDEYFSLCRK